MGDWFNAAQAQYDHATPSYLEDPEFCEDCGEPFEDHCEDCAECECICDDEEEN